MHTQGIQQLTEWKPVPMQLQAPVPGNLPGGEGAFAGLLKSRTRRWQTVGRLIDKRQEAPPCSQRRTIRVAREESRLEEATAGRDRLAPSGDTAHKPDRTPSGDGQDKLKKTVAGVEKAALEEKPDPAALQWPWYSSCKSCLNSCPGKRRVRTECGRNCGRP